MSRSRRKTPIFGNATSPSEKEYKKQYNRERRRKDSVLLTKVAEDGYSVENEFGNPWSGPKDGKTYWEDAKPKDMRK